MAALFIKLISWVHDRVSNKTKTILNNYLGNLKTKSPKPIVSSWLLSVMMTGLKKSTVVVGNYICSVVITLAVQSLILAGAEKPTAVFIFGDSLFDAGNNVYIETARHVNEWPYGETYFGYATGRFTDGRTVPDLICQYANLPLVLPYLQPGFTNYSHGANFASGGAGVLSETDQGRVIDLKTQVANFNKVVKQMRQDLGSEEETISFFSSAVYLFSIGANDYFDANDKYPNLFSQPSYIDEFVDIVIGNFTNALREIHSKGGRKFGFMNLMCNVCSPLVRAQEQGCAKELIASATLHNNALSQALQNLVDEGLDGFKYSILDYCSSFAQLYDNPSKYGFKEGVAACCGAGPYRGYSTCGSGSYFEVCEDPNDFLFFDSVHPTDQANAIIAEKFWTGYEDMAWPYSVKQLFQVTKESIGFQTS